MTGKEKLAKLLKEQIIHSQFTKTAYKRIQVRVTTATNTTRMKVMELQPLVINGQQPVFTGSALLTNQRCYQNTCLTSPCVIKKPIKSGCCNKYILNERTNYPMIKAKTKRYLAKTKEDEFLLVTAQPMTVHSENCLQLKATVQGTYIIHIKPDKQNCNLILDDFELPIRGSVFVNQIVGINTRIPTTFVANSSLQTIDTFPSNTDWNQYGLPTVLILGLISTSIGTAVLMHILRRIKRPRAPTAGTPRHERRESPRLINVAPRQVELAPLQMDLMPIQPRSALRNPNVSFHRNLNIMDEDSSSG